MKKYLTELKGMEKDLKTSFDTLSKNKTMAEHRLKELDEKFILNEISVLYKQNIGLRKHSKNYLGEQSKMMTSLEKDWKVVRAGIKNFEGGAQ